MNAYQIPLQIRLQDNATFENFYMANNRQAVDVLQSAEPYVYLWSPIAAGKSHLLQAVCHSTANSFYLPMAGYDAWQPEILEGLERYEVICLDDIQTIAGKAEWERALFNLFNTLQQNGKRLCVTASMSPKSLAIQLPDLASRLCWGISIKLHSLSDDHKVAALAMRAKARGFDLSEDVSAYLLKHCPRDLHSLFAILEQLDDASLQAQRRISIPFLKQALKL